MTRSRLWIHALVLSAAVAAAAAEEDAKYFAVRMGGGKVGHVKRVRTVAGGKVTSTESMVISLSRMGTPLTIRTTETYVETAAGKPVSFSSVQDMGVMAMKVTGTVGADGRLTVTSVSGGQPAKKTMPWPEGALLAEGMDRLQRAKGLKPGTRYSFKTYMAGLMKVVDVDVVIGEKKPVDVLGRVADLTAVKVTFKIGGSGMTSTIYVNDAHEDLKAVTPMMGMTLELLACDKTFALSPDDTVDFLRKMLVKSDKPLTGAGDAKAVTYHLMPRAGHKLTVPALDNQSVRDGDGGVKIVEVRPVPAPSGAAMPYQGKDAAARAALKPTRFIQCDAKPIIAAARKAVGDAKDAAAAAERIRAFVRGHIRRKDLSIGYATALETLTSRQGDCTEHAVLVAALCRAAGIPARMTCGLVLLPGSEDTLGPHAWAEAFIGGKWVGLDAAMERYDATHIALMIGDGEPDEFFGLIKTLGYFKITDVTIRK